MSQYYCPNLPTNLKRVFRFTLVLFSLALATSLATPHSAQESNASAKTRERAIFAGGCFWCMEPPFDELKGVESTVSGYIGGKTANPKYEDVSAGKTGHVEAVEITYDPTKITYEDLLRVFWRQIEPTDGEGQFVDRGDQYASAIFYLNEKQKIAAEKSKADLQTSGKFKTPIKTEIREATTFYRAEDYHQDYYLKNPVRYKYYRFRSGRDQYLEKIWGKEREIKELLRK